MPENKFGIILILNLIRFLSFEVFGLSRAGWLVCDRAFAWREPLAF
jgi:hypothetical protein